MSERGSGGVEGRGGSEGVKGLKVEVGARE